MNHRDYKEFAPDNYYHIYNRGNGRQNIFCDGQDYFNFLKRLNIVLGKETRAPLVREVRSQGAPLSLRLNPLPKEAFSLLAYCLMPNHFHFLIRQNSEVSVSKLISKISTSYSMYFNRKYNHVGHVFQDRFKAVVVDSDSYLSWLSAYIHQNPKVAGEVKDLKDYAWSSYRDYLGIRNRVLCDKKIILEKFENNTKDYRNFVDDSYDLIKEKKSSEEIFLD